MEQPRFSLVYFVIYIDKISGPTIVPCGTPGRTNANQKLARKQNALLLSSSSEFANSSPMPYSVENLT